MANEVIETTASTLVVSDPKAASLAVPVEEITHCPKRTRISDKGKSKIDSNIWDDAIIAMGRAHNVITPDELKSLSVVPFHKLMSRHIHKLDQVLFCPNLFSSQFLETIPILFIILIFFRSWERRSTSLLSI